MMRLRDDNGSMVFVRDDLVAGRYVYGDPLKPHVHPLSTPSGKVLSLASPHDHRHHKGLMYALQTADVNFWEEVEKPGLAVGAQQHVAFGSVVDAGDVVGFEAALVWRRAAGGDALFEERRSLSCRFDEAGAAFEWHWQTTLRALVDTSLEMSRSSHVKPGGDRVNYHGLGIRFIRDFGATGGNVVLLDGHEQPIGEALGRVAAEVAFIGRLDGRWPPERAGVRIAQAQANALFVMETPFAFMSLGPTNSSPRTLAAGEALSEAYTVRVFDVPA
jgi:hypothetical protein